MAEKASVADKPNIETAYPLMHHLNELRKRLFRCVLCIVVVFALCYWQSAHIFEFIIAPIKPFVNDSNQLTILSLTEGFLTELKICLLAALFLSMPFLLYQLWKFIAPGLYRSERKYLVGFVFSATLLFLGGASFAYYLVFPLGFKFFLSIGEGWGITSTLSIAWYLNFVMKILLAFGVVFELPVVIFFLAKMGIVTAEMLRKYRKFAIVGIFVIAAVITPPDVISQLMMAAPLLVLYELSIWIAKVFGPQKSRFEAASTDGLPDIYE